VEQRKSGSERALLHELLASVIGRIKVLCGLVRFRAFVDPSAVWHLLFPSPLHPSASMAKGTYSREPENPATCMASCKHPPLSRV